MSIGMHMRGGILYVRVCTIQGTISKYGRDIDTDTIMKVFRKTDK